MNNATWPKAFAFIGLTVMGLALAYYSTSIATAGVAGIAIAAVFAYLAVTQIRGISRKA